MPLINPMVSLGLYRGVAYSNVRGERTRQCVTREISKSGWG